MRQIQSLTFQEILNKKDTTEKWILYIGLNMSGVDDLAIKGGEDPADLHVTLLYGYYTPIGTREAAELGVQRAIESIEDFIPEQIEFDATGRFEASESSDGLDVIFARVKAGQLEKAHEAVIEALAKEGIEVEKTFPEYHPHMTLAYIDPEEDFPLEPIKATGTIKDITIGAGPGEEEPVNKANPYHDQLGRFASKGSAGKYTKEQQIKAIADWSDGAYAKIRRAQTGALNDPHRKEQAEAIEEFIEQSPKYTGDLYRGISTDEQIRFRIGQELDMNGVSSWSKSEDAADEFARWDDHSYMFVTSGLTKAADVSMHTMNPGEQEVLVSVKTKFKVTHVEFDPDINQTTVVVAEKEG